MVISHLCFWLKILAVSLAICLSCPHSSSCLMVVGSPFLEYPTEYRTMSSFDAMFSFQSVCGFRAIRAIPCVSISSSVLTTDMHL